MEHKIDKALALLNRIAVMMARRPDELRMQTEVGNGTVEVTFECNPADTRRLVGRGADNLKQLATIFRLLARDSGMVVRICELVSNRNQEPPFEAYRSNPNWPRQEIETLLRDLSEAVFELPAEVMTERHTDYSVKMRATVLGNLDGNRVMTAFAKAVNVLFIPIGTNHGMKVYAHVADYTQTLAQTGAVA